MAEACCVCTSLLTTVSPEHSRPRCRHSLLVRVRHARLRDGPSWSTMVHAQKIVANRQLVLPQAAMSTAFNLHRVPPRAERVSTPSRTYRAHTTLVAWPTTRHRLPTPYSRSDSLGFRLPNTQRDGPHRTARAGHPAECDGRVVNTATRPTGQRK